MWAAAIVQGSPQGGGGRVLRGRRMRTAHTPSQCAVHLYACPSPQFGIEALFRSASAHVQSAEVSTKVSSPPFRRRHSGWRTQSQVSTRRILWASETTKHKGKKVRFYFITQILYFFLLRFRAAGVAYGSSQAQGGIRAAAASLRNSHNNARSKTCLRPTPPLMVTHWVGPGIEPTSSLILVGVFLLLNDKGNS